MYKTIIITMLMLIGMMGMAQEDYLLKRFYRLNQGDTSYMYKFEYNEDFSLNNYKLIINNGVFDEFTFENDTLITSQEYDRTYTYHYFEDSTIQIEWSGGDPDTAIRHYLDDQDRVIHTYEPDGIIDHFYNEWEGDNVSKHSYNLMGVLYYFTIDYSEYLNPLYPVYKSLRLNSRSSWNYPTADYDEQGDPLRTYEVAETLGSYPTVVNGWDEHNHELRYEYIVVTGVEDTPAKERTVLSVDYFDIMGRKMPKPNKGFYIERKTTDKGIISTKHYIQ